MYICIYIYIFAASMPHRDLTVSLSGSGYSKEITPLPPTSTAKQAGPGAVTGSQGHLPKKGG